MLDVTVLITSCGRQDLLETTIDSFLEHNTYPVKEFIVMEDGDGSRNDILAKKYGSLNFRWLASGKRIGQIEAIDFAYENVTTEFVFHCEDDWRFTAPGFIEKSLSIIESDPSILQVWLRALDDTNGHPLLEQERMARGVPYRLLRHYHEWGGVNWHGFSWNPGLRRMREYRRIASFGALDPAARKENWRVESEAGAFYQRRGFYAAIITDRGGKGYVHHIGGERRVVRD